MKPASIISRIILSILLLVIPGTLCFGQLVQTAGSNNVDYDSNDPGNDASWTLYNADGFRIGTSADGLLTVNGSGTVHNFNAGSNNFSGAAFLGFSSGKNGIANVSGTNSLWRNDGPLYVGFAGIGNLDVFSGGKVISSKASIGLLAGSSGDVDVYSGGLWENSGTLQVGQNGTGSLSITSSGTVTSPGGILGTEAGSIGTVNVAGNSSLWDLTGGLNVGSNGTGTLTIKQGGQVTTKATSYIGRFGTGVGKVNVEGSTSTWNNNSNLNIGLEGSGELNVLAGGKVVNGGHGTIGSSELSTGTVNVEGAGSHWDNSGSLYVGQSGTGTLNVDSGGQVDSSWAYLGQSAGSDGTVTIQGQDGMGNKSRWEVAAGLQVGGRGSAELKILDGGVVTTNGTSSIANLSGSDGTVTVSGAGSLWDVNSTATMYFGRFGEGTLNVLDGGTVTSTGRIELGNGISSKDVANISGANSLLSTTSLTLGGEADLNIEAGGKVTSSLNSLTYGLTSVKISGAGSEWDLSNNKLDVEGKLEVLEGGLLRNGVGTINGNKVHTVSGDGSRWENSKLEVYDYADGIEATLNILDKGVVKSNGGRVEGGYSSGPGNTGGGRVTVTDDGSLWDTRGGSLSIGGQGTGTLDITDNGVVQSSAAVLGFQYGTGIVNVTNGGQWTNSGNLDVGVAGTGTLNIETGATVSNLNGNVGSRSSGAGTVNISGSGSSWTTANDLSVGGFGKSSVCRQL